MSKIRVEMTCTTPGMLHATSESRVVALKYYNLEFTTFLNGKTIYFDFNRDIIFVVTCHSIGSFGGVFMAPSVSVHRSTSSLKLTFKHPWRTVVLYGKYIDILLRDLHQIQQSTLQARQNTANTIK
jgi:hypothetical protein